MLGSVQRSGDVTVDGIDTKGINSVQGTCWVEYSLGDQVDIPEEMIVKILSEE